MPRPRTPTALAALRGFPGHRPQNRQEPQPAPAALAPPVALDPPAQRIWDRHAGELVRLGVLTQADTTIFASACRLQAMGDQYATDVEGVLAAPPKTKGARRHRVPPSLWVAIKCWDKAAALFGRFGMTPADRAKLHVTESDADDELTAYRQARTARG